MKNIRLNAYLCQSGLCSRRKADELIKSGDITINHWPMTDLSYTVQEKDTVRYKKIIVKPESLSYVLLNKPTGYVTTMDDQFNRPTVMDLLGKEIKSRVYPIGRLDYDTTGVLLLTNDGQLAHILAHPRLSVPKLYLIKLKEDLSLDHIAKIKKGVFLKDGPARVDNIKQAYDAKSAYVTIHSGRNRIVRRIFESFGYTVKKLERVSFAGLTTKGVKLGDWRFLTPAEVKKLQSLSPDAKPKKTIKKVAVSTKKQED